MSRNREVRRRKVVGKISCLRESQSGRETLRVADNAVHGASKVSVGGSLCAAVRRKNSIKRAYLSLIKERSVD